MATNKEDNEGREANSGNNEDSADNFGLPDIEYKPLDREEPTSAKEPEPMKSGPTKAPGDYGYDEDEPKSKAPLFIGLIIAVVVLVGGFLVYKYWYVPRGIKAQEELARKTEAEKQAAENARLARLADELAKKKQDSIAAANAKPAVGTIETLTERTRRYFVVVSSNIDDDLLMDYARELSQKGVSSKIIPPVGTSKFFRLAIADFDTYSAAQANADAAKSQFGNALWVMRF